MSFFFKDFAETDYNGKNVCNILTAFFLKRLNYNKKVLYQQYSIEDKDIPEYLSKKFYGSEKFYWSFLIINDIIDPYCEWVIDYETLERFVVKKYKDGIVKRVKNETNDIVNVVVPHSIGLYGIHHFYNILTDRICDEVDDEYYRYIYGLDPKLIGERIIPVTNFEYERDLNEKNRQISIVDPRQIVKLEDDFRKMLRGDE